MQILCLREREPNKDSWKLHIVLAAGMPVITASQAHDGLRIQHIANNLMGQANIQPLANELDSAGFWNFMQLDEDSRVTAVLFAHPQSLALDCTYKMNKYSTRCLSLTLSEWMPVNDRSVSPLPF